MRMTKSASLVALALLALLAAPASVQAGAAVDVGRREALLGYVLKD
jgi:hypothetical protein